MRFSVAYNLTMAPEHTGERLIVNTAHNAGEHGRAPVYHRLLTIKWKDERAGQEQAGDLGVTSALQADPVHLPALGPWEGDSASPCLFPGLRNGSAVVRIKRVNPRQALRTSTGTR